MKTIWGWLMDRIFPKPKDRRANRGNEIPDKREQQYNIMRNALIEIMNMTKAQMTDSQFRDWVQDRAHSAISAAECGL